MVIGITLGIALVLGYLVTVGLALAATFWLTAASPRFVRRGFCLSNSYKSAHEFLWLLCAGAGGYVGATIGGTLFPWVAALGLAAALIAVLWVNAWESQQRGMAHQIAISALTLAGVVGGYLLRFRTT